MKKLFSVIALLSLLTLSVSAANNLSVNTIQQQASSSVSDTFLPGMAIDYLSSTYWQPQTAEAGEWLLLEWAQPTTMNNLQIEWDASQFAREYSIYAFDEVPDTIFGRKVNAGMLPDSVATLIYHQGARTKLNDRVEIITTREFTTKYLLFVMGASATKNPIHLSEIYTFHIEVPKLTRFSVLPRMVVQGVDTDLTLQTLDQDGKAITDNIVISIPDTLGTLSKGKLKATVGGWLEVTATDTLNEKTLTQRIYVIGDSVAPPKPVAAEVYASLLPASAGTTTYLGTGQKKADPVAGELKLDGQSVKMVHTLGALTINNDQVTAKPDSTFSPASRLYEKLRMSLFSPTDATGTLTLAGVDNISLTLTGGEWKTVEIDVADKTRMGNIELDFSATDDGYYPEVALANIYFTKSPLRLTSLEASPRLVVVGDSLKMQLTARDQLDKVMTDNVVYTIEGGTNAKLTDKGWIVPRQHGWITIVATDTLTNNQAQAHIYALGKEDAPTAPDSASVYAGLVPPTAGTTVYTADKGNKAQPAEVVKLNKQEAKIVYSLGTLTLSNSTVSSALGATFNPAQKFYGKLHFEIFSPTAATGQLAVEQVDTLKLTVPAGQWAKVEVDVSKVSKMGNIVVSLDKLSSGDYPDALLSNVYFTKAEIDSTDFVMTNLEIGNTFIPKNQAVDLKLKPKNAKGVEVTVYGIPVTYTADKGSFDAKGLFTATADGPITIVGTAGQDKLLRRDTVYVYTYPDPDSKPLHRADSVIAVYSDTYGATTYSPSDNAKNGGYSLQREIALTTSDRAIYVEKAVCFGLKLDNINLDKCDSLHLSIYSYGDQQAHLAIEGTDMSSLAFMLKARQWNHVVLPLSGTRTAPKWLYLYVGTDSQKNNVIIDNVYFTLDPKYGIVDRFTMADRFVPKNQPVDLGLAVYNRLNTNITEDVTFTVTKGELSDTHTYIIKEDGPVTITALGTMGSKQSLLFHTLPDPATKPEDQARRVSAVYSDTYGATKYSATGTYSKVYEVALASGDKAIAALDAQTVSLSLGNIDLSDYIWLKASIFATEDYDGFIEIEGTFMSPIPIHLSKYQWLDLKLILTDYRARAVSLNFNVGEPGKTNNVVLDNIVFVKMDPNELEVARQPDANGFVAVVGVITNQNVALINSLTDAAIDVSKATFTNEVHNLSPKNPNTLILVSSEYDDAGEPTSAMGRHLWGSRNMVMKRGDGIYVPVEKIEIYDTEDYPVWNGGVIQTGDKGFTYTRTFVTGYTTATFPCDYTLPAYSEKTNDGFKVYNMYQYDATFGIYMLKQNNTEVKKHQPYVLYVSIADGGRKRLTIEGKGDLDLRQSSCGTDRLPYDVAMHGNYSRSAGTGWYYMVDAGSNQYFFDVMADTPVPAFRAYFTGAEPDQGRRIFMRDNLQRISFDDLENDPQGTVVNGPVNAETKPLVEALNKAYIDLSDAVVSIQLKSIKPVSQNAIICVQGTVFDDGNIISTVGESLTETNNVVVKDVDGGLHAYKQLQLIDDGKSQVWVGGTIDTGKHGYVYTRTLEAFEYTTSVVPVSLTVPDGVEIYTYAVPYDSDSGLTLTRLDQRNLEPHKPYVLFNNNEQAVELRATGTGKLDLREFQLDSIKYQKSEIVFTGNYGPNKGSDVRYVLDSKAAAQAVRGHGVPKLDVSLTPVELSTVMPPFRSYFVRIPTSGKKTVTFIDPSKILTLSEPDENGIVTVTGLLDKEGLPTVEAVEAGLLNLTGTLFDDNLGTITPSNPNMLVIVDGTVDGSGNVASSVAKYLGDTQNLVIRNGANSYVALNKILLTDSDQQQLPWGNLAIDTRSLGYSYKRTIAAGQTTTIVVPDYATLPSQVVPYSSPSYSAERGLGFFVSEATLLSKNAPYLVTNMGDTDATITVEGTGFLDLRTSAEGYSTVGPMRYVANYSRPVSTAEEPIYVYDSQLLKFVALPEGKSATPMRVYFAGMTTDTEITYVTGPLSGIADITVDTDSDKPYYLLDGRTVATPRKGGLYIRDGKKVVVR